MTQEELKKLLNNKAIWEMFEELANNDELVYMPNADFRYANCWKANFSQADLSHANFGSRELVEEGEKYGK